MNAYAKGNGPVRQRGASSLFITVILVLVVMLLAVTAAVLSSTQFKLAGNLQYENIAFNLAEGALASAENWLSTKNGATYTNARNANFATYTEGSYYYPIGSLAAQTPALDPQTMTDANWSSYARAVNADGSTSNPDPDGTGRYLIEKYGADNQPLGTGLEVGGRPLSGCQKVDVFLISARGTSAKGTTKLVQTTYSVPSC